MATRDKQPNKRKTKSRVVTGAIVGLLLLLAFLFRSCLGLGLGTGSDDGTASTDAMAVMTLLGDANAAPGGDAGARQKSVCMVRIDSKGIQVDGRSAEIDEVVQICRRAGTVSLHATDSARTGTYQDLVRALADAGVAGVPQLDEHRHK